MRRLSVLLAFLMCIFAMPVWAQIGNWQETPQASTRLIASTRVTEPGKLYAGLQLKLAPGWHAYWRSPGDAGLPPQPEWGKSVNLDKATLLFPWPTRYAAQGLETYGYEGEVLFPVEIIKKNAADAVDLNAKMSLLVCSDICVPAPFDISLSIPANFASPEAADEATSLLAAGFKKVPKVDDGQGLHLLSATLSQEDGHGVIELAYAGGSFTDAEIVGEVGDGSTIPIAQTKLVPEKGLAVGMLDANAPKDLAGKELTFTLVDKTNQQAVEKKLVLGSADVMPPPLAAPVPVVTTALDPITAFRNFNAVYSVAMARAMEISNIEEREGVIRALNQKRATYASAAEAAREVFNIEAQKLALDPKFTDMQMIPPDMLASMADNPLMMDFMQKRAEYNLKNSQHLVADAPAPMPNFWAMIIFALIGGLILNLMPCVLPVLAIKSLSFINHGGGTPAGVRLSFLATSAGILVSFFVMAACIIGLKQFGMSVGWGVQFQHPAFLIFLIVILVLLAANLWGFFEITLPRFLADRLSWTQGHGNLAKDFLYGAFATLLATPCTAPFLGTAVSFALAAGPREILAVFVALGVGLAAPFLMIAAFPKSATLLPHPGKWMVVLKRVLAALLFLTALWLGYVLSMQVGEKHGVQEARWIMFDETQITSSVSQGKIVFVDVTADWCLTCQANKRFVIDKADVQQALSNDRIILMKADWTKPDETIAAYLKKNMRYGIPFNVIYGPSAPQGVILPELLTQKAILEGLQKAGL
jgi:suppressor for copper-sensitivity B